MYYCIHQTVIKVIFIIVTVIVIMIEPQKVAFSGPSMFSLCIYHFNWVNL